MAHDTEKTITHQHSITFFCLIIGVILLFLTLEPKISSLVIPGKSQAILIHFLSKTKTAQTVNAQDFWQFREFYSPGSYDYDSGGVPIPQEFAKYLKSAGLKPTLTFTSSKLVSAEGHTMYATLPAVTIFSQPGDSLLIHTPETLLIKRTDGSYLLVFLKTIPEMKKANGFLQHETAVDNKAGNYWLSISSTKP